MVANKQDKGYWDMTIEFMLINIGAGFAPDLWSIVEDAMKKKNNKKEVASEKKADFADEDSF